MSELNDIAKDLAGGRTLEDLRRVFTDRDRAKVQKTPEQSERERAYWERVYSSRPVIARRTRRVVELRAEMPYEQARKEVVAMLEVRQSELAILRSEPDFKIQFTPEQGRTIEALIRWLINDSNSALPLHQGVWLWGQPGTFKTELMLILEKLSSGLQKEFVFTDFSIQYAENEKNVQFNRCFDEFLKRTDTVKSYGNAFSPVEYIIENRYNRFMRYGQFTIIISNFSPAQAADMLSPQAFDRLRAMVNSIEMPGESKRR